MKNIIITGAGGFVATELTRHLLSLQGYRLFLLSTDPSKLTAGTSDNVKCFTLEEFKRYEMRHGLKYHCLINAAFARSSDGDKLADAIQYTYHLMTYATTIRLHRFINISSQGVYGHSTAPMWTENATCAPDYMYALGKFSTEMLSHAILGQSGLQYTNIRLASVCENARFMNIFCNNALNGVPIRLSAPDQVTSFISVHDAALALERIIAADEDTQLAPTYNLGTGECHTIREIANAIKEVGKSEYNLSVKIIEEKSDNISKVGMDSSLFMRTFNWKPLYDLIRMISSLYKYNVAAASDQYPQPTGTVQDNN